MRLLFIPLLALPAVLVRSFTPIQQPRATTALSRDFQLQSSSPVVSTMVATGLLGLLLTPVAALANSGGSGTDYANMDITGQDFSNGSYNNKDFSKVTAKGAKFQKSELQGSRFFKAFLENADFSGADVRGASFEDASLDGVSLRDANARGARFSASILDVEDLENADLTNSLWPSKLQIMICDRGDLKGINPITGVDTRASILCPP